MRPVTDSFLNTIRGAHKALFRARIVSPGLTGVNPGTLNPDGSPLNEIPLLSGDVTFDTHADINATMSIQTTFNWPSNAASLGSPYGQEIFIERGVSYGNGIREYVGLGYFRINSVEQERVPKGLIRITGEDRMSSVRDARKIQPMQFASGTSVGALLDFVVDEAYPGVTTVYDWDAYSALLVSDHILGEDRLKFVQELVSAYGKVCYFDYAGRFVVKTNPGLGTGTPVWEINSGRNGVLVAMKRTITRDGVYNGVVATGEPAGELPPVRGVALDMVTTSPTYWLGSFGKVPRFFSSSFMTTQAQCESAAASILAGSTGLPYAVQLGTVPNPAIEGWDVVSVRYDNFGSYEIHIVDKITYGLAVEGAMGIDTRKQFLT